MTASWGERAKPPAAESRIAAPNASAPGAWVAAYTAPAFGHTVTSVPSGSGATCASIAAPAGSRVVTPGRPCSMARTYAALRRAKVSSCGVGNAGS